MILDCHIHSSVGKPNPKRLMAEMKQGGIDGGVVISLPPACFVHFKGPNKPQQRLETVMKWTAGAKTLFPFYWIDPTEKDAVAQVKAAVKAGIAGFKTICNHFYPGDTAAMDTYRDIAKANKPLLFHSGILWDGQNSSKYNRPAEFEALIDVPKLRFALAHISWPWVDECIALYGKFQAAHASRPDPSCEMFIDTTPGTPEIYRREALTKIFTVGYRVADNVLFGTDASTGEYGYEWAKVWLCRDQDIYRSVNLDQAGQDKVFYKNLLRFLGRKAI